MPAREARRRDDRQMGNDIRAAPREVVLHRVNKHATAGGGPEGTRHGAEFVLEYQIAEARNDYGKQKGSTSESGDVLRRLEEPPRADGQRRITGLAEKPE